MDNILTIFTPTFNRAYILPQLYQSLIDQSNHNFTWFIIDDGSSDCTEQLVMEWIALGLLKIDYLKVENGGKQRAINLAIDRIESDYLFIVDSDDVLTNDCVQVLFEWIRETKSLPFLAGFAGLKGNLRGDRIKNNWSVENINYVDALNSERESLNLLEDKAEVFKMSVLKKFSLRIHPMEKFIPESYLLNAIAYAGYKFRWYNRVIYLCDYIEDGYTQNGKSLAKRNSRSFAILHIANSNYGKKIFFRFRSQIKAIAFMSFHWNFSELSVCKDKYLLFFSFPIGICVGLIKQFQWRDI